MVLTEIYKKRREPSNYYKRFILTIAQVVLLWLNYKYFFKIDCIVDMLKTLYFKRPNFMLFLSQFAIMGIQLTKNPDKRKFLISICHQGYTVYSEWKHFV